MLINFSELWGTKIRAVDGEVGTIENVYFDDRHWTTRYFVADTGGWLTGRQVLLSPTSLQRLDAHDSVAEFDLTREQIENSPGIGADQPVSRQHEAALIAYYPWPAYWAVPGPPIHPRVETLEEGDPHLRGVREVQGYYIEATDGDLGHVEDFVFDDHDWQIRFVVVDTRNWWPGKKVLVSPEWITSVDWATSRVHVSLTRDEVRGSPEYRVDQPLSEDYERQLRAHYRRPSVGRSPQPRPWP
jgi:uncharacterized protein YrrD